MPQMVAIFNGFGGGASALVACSEFLKIGNEPSLLLIISIMPQFQRTGKSEYSNIFPSLQGI